MAYLIGPKKVEWTPIAVKRDEQQRDVVEQQARRAEQHDQDFGGLHDAHDARLVASNRRVARQAPTAGRRAG